MERAQSLARSATLSLVDQRIDAWDVARSAIVLGCAAALIMAGRFLPF
jgi:hypothetical protein